MKDNSIWRIFCETGEPVCYLIYRSAMKETKTEPYFPPQDTVAFSGTGQAPRVRF